jgi:hypothetical protein
MLTFAVLLIRIGLLIVFGASTALVLYLSSISVSPWVAGMITLTFVLVEGKLVFAVAKRANTVVSGLATNTNQVARA